MRTLLKATFDVEAANRAIQDGSLPKIIESTIDPLRPEANYFTTENGQRCMYVVFNLTETSQIPKIAEPLFMRLKADITFAPVMNREDLAVGLRDLNNR